MSFQLLLEVAERAQALLVLARLAIPSAGLRRQILHQLSNAGLVARQHIGVPGGDIGALPLFAKRPVP